MKNYDELLLQIVNDDNIDIVIKIITEHLSQLESH